MSITKQLKGPIVECVPNFSDGRRKRVIDTISNEIDSVPNVRVLDVHSDYDHNRSVITFIGKPAAVLEAGIAAVRAASRLIDLREHEGVHPRLGAVDVIPLVPIRDIGMGECVKLAREMAKRIWLELDIPTYLYGNAALKKDRIHLEKVRLKGFEQMRELVLKDKSRRPDFGGPALHPSAGASIVGARAPLIAFNVNLKSRDIEVAKEIAEAIREKNSGLIGLKAMGLKLSSGRRVQISTNITRTDLVSPYKVFELVREEAGKRGIEVACSELVGLMPLDSLMRSMRDAVRLDSFDRSRVVEFGP
jgi:glutamate formiminotransferase